MKQLIYTTLLLSMTLTTPVISQLRLDFAVGGNISNIALRETTDIPFGEITESITGYYFEASPNLQLSNKIKFQFNTQFSQKGFQFKEERSSLASSFRFTYLDIIPELEFSILRFLSVGVGVNYGLKLRERTRLADDQPWAEVSSSFSSGSDLGLAGKIKVVFGNLFVYTRFNRSIRSLAEVTFTGIEGQELITTDTFNKNVQFGLGYSFGI